MERLPVQVVGGSMGPLEKAGLLVVGMMILLSNKSSDVDKRNARRMMDDIIVDGKITL